MDTVASKKQRGRPKKIVDYDHEYVIDFLRLFITEAQSWDDCIGKSVEINDLIERDIYGKFVEMDMLNKLKDVLMVRDFKKLRYKDRIKEMNDVIDLFKSICGKKNFSVEAQFYYKYGITYKKFIIIKIT